MVFNGVVALSVAQLSAETWQRLRRIPPSERISSQQMLDLVCCFPLGQVARLALWFWTYLCVPPPDSFNSFWYYPSSDDDDDDDDDDYGNGRGGFDDGSGSSSSSSSSSTVDLDGNYYHRHTD